MENFSFIELFRLAKRRLWIVAATVLIFVAAAFLYGVFLLKPAYSANATVLVASGVLFKDDESNNINAEYITTAELSTTLALMKSFKEILNKSVDYYDSALELAESKGLNETYTRKDLTKKTKINYSDDSIFITITVRTSDKEDAVTLVSALAEKAPGCITDKIGRTSAVVLNTAENATKVSVGTGMLCLLAAVAGVIIGVVILIVAEKLDHTIKDEDDYVRRYDVPVLGTVPEFISNKKKRGFKARG